jgi:hypothetical protein
MIPNGSKPIINDDRKRERNEPKVQTLHFPQNALRLSELKKVLIYETNSSTHYVVRYHGFLNGFFGVKLIGVHRSRGTLELGPCQGKNFNSIQKTSQHWAPNSDGT